MADILVLETSPERIDENTIPGVRPNALVHEYLGEHLDIYRELRILREQGWKNEAADAFFRKQRKHADKADDKTKKGFFKLMRNIARELNRATSAFDLQGSSNSGPAILDLCMAPGGFSSFALSRNPCALLRGISLPPSQGGYEMLLQDSWSDTDPNARIYVSFRDITLLADEMGTPISSIPASHPDAASFSPDRPFLDEEFDIVLCDGQILRTYERSEYRKQFEASRLLMAQLILGLQRVRSGGTMVVLLHKADAWRSVLLLHTFAAFVDNLELFKPSSGHRTRSSFYLVAKGVRPEHEAAAEAVRVWKARWRMATFGLGGDSDRGGVSEAELEVLESGGLDKVKSVLQEFGPTLVRLVEPVFAIQATALKTAPWMKAIGKHIQV